MAIQQARRYCNNCNRYVLATRHKPDEALGCIAIVLTGGLWLIVMFFHFIFEVIGTIIGTTGFRCPQCGAVLSFWNAPNKTTPSREVATLPVVTCPHCSRRYKIDANQPGMVIRCSCGSRFDPGPMMPPTTAQWTAFNSIVADSEYAIPGHHTVVSESDLEDDDQQDDAESIFDRVPAWGWIVIAFPFLAIAIAGGIALSKALSH